MADITNLNKFLTDVADAIRTKNETTDPIPAEEFDTEILKIETGVDTSDATATENDIVSPKTAYVNGEKVIGTIMPTYKELEEPSVVGELSEITLPLDTEDEEANAYTVTSVCPSGNFFVRVRAYLATKSFKIYVYNSEGVKKQTYSWTATTFSKANYIQLYVGYETSNTFDILVKEGNVSVIRYHKTANTLTKVTINNNWGNDSGINHCCLSTTLPFYTRYASGMWTGNTYTGGSGPSVSWIDNFSITANCMMYFRGQDLILSNSGGSYVIKFPTDINSGSSVYATKYSYNNTVAISNKYIYSGGKVYNKYNTSTSVGTYSISGHLFSDIKGVNMFAITSNSQVSMYKVVGPKLEFVQTFALPTAIQGSNPQHAVTTKYVPVSEKFILGNYVSNGTFKVIKVSYDGAKELRGLNKDGVDYVYTTDATATEADILAGETAYVDTELVTGTMPNNGSKYYTPTTSNITIPQGYHNGSGYVRGDANLIAENIKKDVTIFNVTGTHDGIMTEADYNACETIADGILGNSIPVIPIEYIETTGTQWLDTGTPLFNSNTWKIELDFAPTAIYNYNGIWSTTEHSLSYESFITERKHQYSVYMVGSSGQDYISMSANTRYKYIDEFTGTSVISYVDGVQKRSYNTSVSKSTYNLTLFQCSEDNSKLKLYSAKLYADGVLVRDFIPAKDGTGKIGLYDNVTDEFYYNAGTGTFVGGGVL